MSVVVQQFITSNIDEAAEVLTSAFADKGVGLAANYFETFGELPGSTLRR